MEIPDGYIQLAVGGVMSFFVNQIYKEIKEQKEETKRLNEKFTNNDRELYEKITDLKVKNENLTSKWECLKGK